MVKTRKVARCNFNVTFKQAKKLVKLAKNFDLYDLKYNKPEKNDLAIGLVYFNSAKSKRLLMNYLYVAEKFKIADIPYFTIEMYEESPEISDAIHVKTNFILFQKERLCYLLEKYIPKSYSKLLFIDCDLIFGSPDWYNELSNKLDNFNVVQPFSKPIWLDITYRHIVKQRIPIIFYNNLGKIAMDDDLDKYQPGFAWAFQRNWFNKVGFFQHGILGGGDTFSSSVWLDYNLLGNKDFLKQALEDYKKKMGEKPSVCFLKGTIFHLWHGESKKRQYGERHNIFKSVKDIRDIIRVANNGLFELKDDSLKLKIRKYFRNRDDDGLAVN